MSTATLDELDPPMAATSSPHPSHEPRPASKTILPFRCIADGNGEVYIESFAVYADGQRSPHNLHLGDPHAESTRLYKPVALGIYNMMQMFYAVEDERDGLAAERDRLLSRVAMLEGRLGAKEVSDMAREAEKDRRAAGGNIGTPPAMPPAASQNQQASQSQPIEIKRGPGRPKKVDQQSANTVATTAAQQAEIDAAAMDEI